MKQQVDIKPETTSVWMLRLAAVLWVIWGLVHVLAGVMTITQDTPEAIGGIADAVDPETLKLAYPDAAGAVINQHGFNLLWIGVVTTACAVFVWRRSPPAIFLAVYGPRRLCQLCSGNSHDFDLCVRHWPQFLCPFPIRSLTADNDDKSCREDCGSVLGRRRSGRCG